MANVDFTYTVGFVADTSMMREQIVAFQGNLQSNPLNLKTALPDMDTTGAQKALDAIKNQSQSIEKVTAQTITMKNAAGEAYTEITGLLVNYTTKLGEAAKATIPLNSSLSDLDKNSKAFENMSKKATEWSTRSESMGKKEQQQIQVTSQKLKEQIDLRAKLISAGKYTEASAMDKSIRSTNAEFDKLVASTKRSATGLQSWGESITRAIKQTITYSFSLGLIRQAQQLLNQGIQYAIELNKEMVNIQVIQAEGAQSPEEIKSLATAYNDLARAMGVTTLEVARGSVEWLRQGKTIEQTTQLLKSSTMLSKLGALESAEATEYLTSTLNSYNMSAEQATSVVDKLVAVDNASATSTRELATALKYVAASAQESGVTLEQLISYIGVISSTTRLNAESIGQAMKTIFTRMQDIKAGKIDEDGLGINNVESALSRVNIKLRDSRTEFRDMGTVLEELAKKWGTLNEIEQANISKSVAGVRQTNMFKVLMTNMNDALELQKVQLNSAGLAMDRYQIYLKGVEAAQNKLTASMERFWQDAVSSGLITQVIDLATALVDLINNAGGLKTVITLATGALITFNAVTIGTNLAKFAEGLTAVKKAFEAIALATGLANDALIINNRLENLDTTQKSVQGMKALSGASKVAAAETTVLAGAETTAAGAGAGLAATLGTVALAVGAVVLVIGGLIALTDYLSKAQERANQAFSEASDKATQASNAYAKLRSTKASVEELWKEFETLRDKTGKSAEEIERLTEVQNQLNEVSDYNLSGTYDADMNFLISKKATLSEITDILNEQIDAQKILATEALKEASAKADAAAAIADAKKKDYEWTLANQTQVLAQEQGAYGAAGIGVGDMPGEAEKRTEEKVKAAEKGIKEAERLDRLSAQRSLTIYKMLMSEEEKEQWKSLQTRQSNLEAISEYEQGLKREQMQEQYAALMPKKEPKVKIDLDTDSSMKKIEELRNSIKSVEKAIDEVSKGENLSENLKVLDEAKIKWEVIDGAIVPATDSLNEFYDAQIKAVEENYNLSRSAQEVFNGIRNSLGGSIGDLTLTTSQFTNFANNISTVLFQLAQKSNNLLTDHTGVALVSAQQIEQALISGAVTFEELIGDMTNASKEDLSSVASYAQQLAKFISGISKLSPVAPTFEIPDYKSAIQKKLKEAEKAAKEEAKRAAEEQKRYYEEEKKAIEGTIDALNDKKRALQDQLDEFNDYIDAQKESLRLQKEEKEFADELAKKNKSLAKIKEQIAILELDNSEEAKAKRLKLQEEAASLEEDITKDKEDRKYDLQIEALEKVQKQFEDAIDAQIRGIEDTIASYQQQISVIEEQISSIKTEAEATDDLGIVTDSTGQIIYDTFTSQIQLTEEAKAKLQEEIQGWIDKGLSIEDALEKLKEYASVASSIPDVPSGGGWGGDSGGGGGGTDPFAGGSPFDPNSGTDPFGGGVPFHHNGGFAGDLNSNEEFAKLLKGEYVATEADMKNFMGNVLPRIVNVSNEMGDSKVVQENQISIAIPIDGNVDEDVMANLEDTILKTVNKAMKQVGKIRPVSAFSI